MDVTHLVSHMEEMSKVMLLHGTNSQSLEERSVRFALKGLGTGLGELGYMLLGEVKENSTFFLTDTCLFVRKAQQIFWWVTDAFRVENSPDKLLYWPEMTRPWHQVSVFRIYRIVIKSVHKGCHKKERLYFPTEININSSLVEKPLPFYCFKPLNFLIISHRKKSFMNFYKPWIYSVFSDIELSK